MALFEYGHGIVAEDNERFFIEGCSLTQPDDIVLFGLFHKNTSSPLNAVTVLRFTLRICPEAGIRMFIVLPELWKLVQRHSSTVTSSPFLATKDSENDG
jgi:hypothetical protein